MYAIPLPRSVRHAPALVLLAAATACGVPSPDGSANPPGAGARGAGLVCGAPASPVGSVQGPGAASPRVGTEAVVEGVVVADFEGPPPALGGFYLQDAGDGDPATSDGVFVATGGADRASAGGRVRVRGTVREVDGQTTLAEVDLAPCPPGGAPPEAVDVQLPLPAADALEPLEGMLVRIPGRLTVTDVYALGRYAEVTLSAGGRLPQPTEVAAPGAAARAVAEANDRNRIVLDDATLAENPEPVPFARGADPLSAGNTLRGGDEVEGLTGVLTWTPAGADGRVRTWRIRPAGAGDASPASLPAFRPANPRPGPVELPGSLRVGAFNLLNYFDTFDGCSAGVGGGPTGCRGADGPAEFERQWRKTVAAITGLGVDVLGVVEVENDGYGPESALAHLVERLEAATASGRWAFIDVDAATGTVNALGTDAIKVGLLYRRDRVTPVGSTAVLATEAFVTGGDPAPRNRPSLAQAFETREGERLVVSVSHLKSKGSPCEAPDPGDGQGNCNEVRTTAARELADWLATDPTTSGDPDVLVVGDLNAYAREDPIRVLTDAGFVDLLERHEAAGSYTYVFRGAWGSLDHALASPSLARQVVGATAWHVNADEPPVLDYDMDFESESQREILYAPDPYRSSDHDPVVVGIDPGGR